MGMFDRLFGADQQAEQQPPQPPRRQRTDDEIAVERYRYLLRTAPPETLEQVHTEAFSKLTDEQRAMVFEELSRNAPAGEAPRGQDARSLAQAATRSELRQPGTMERSFQGPSFGAMVGSSILGTIAGYVIASALVSAFMPMDGGEAGADGAGDSGSGAGDSGADSSDAGSDASTDAGADGGFADGGFADGGFDDGGFGDGGFGGGDFGGDFGF